MKLATELMSLDALMRRLPAVISPRTGDDAELAIVYNSRGPYWVAGYRRISDNKWLQLPSAKVVHEDDDLKRCLYLLMTDLEGGVKDKKNNRRDMRGEATAEDSPSAGHRG
jgi:hypothetical protein